MDTYDNGIRTIRIAFSCTCQPNMNAVSPQRVIARINASLRTFLKKTINNKLNLIVNLLS